MKKRGILFLMMGLLLLSGCKGETKQPEPTETGDFTYEIVDEYVRIVDSTEDIHVTVPEKIEGYPVQVIGDNAFYNKKSMVSIDLPSSLLKIENAAFYRCYSLKEIEIPASVTDIGEGAFFRTISLTRVNVDKKNPNYSDIDGVLFDKKQTILHTYPEGREQTRYEIPSTVTEISESAFGYRCRHLRELVIPSGVVTFPDYNMFVYPEDITLFVQAGSAAEQYAKQYDLNYTVV